MRLRNILIFSAILAAVCALYLGWYATPSGGYPQHVHPYVRERDRQAIMQLFEQDWQWLVADDPETYSAAYRIDYAAPSKAPGDVNRMQIDVYRTDDRTVGFVAYYMESFYKGVILFLAVHRDYRGQGIARTLLDHAVEQLERRGARVVELITRTDNYAAQRVYEGYGFRKMWVHEPFITYRYHPGQMSSHSYAASHQAQAAQHS